MSGYYDGTNMNGLLAAMMKPTRRKVFVSYHHGGDQAYYDAFSNFFHVQYEAVRDSSLRQSIQSDNTDYVMRQIREQYISGTSWEVKATLDKNHGLVGIVLPTHAKNPNGEIIVPERFLDNHKSGYAVWAHWTELTVQKLTLLIDAAIAKSQWQIDHSRPMRQRNG
jgi:hypothetical protein